MSNPDYKALYEALLDAHTVYVRSTNARLAAVEDELYTLRGQAGIRPSYRYDSGTRTYDQREETWS